MGQLLDCVTEQRGGDYLHRDYYSMNAMIELEAINSPVSKMLEYWLELKNGASAAPKAEAFQLSKLWEMRIPNRATIIDCSAEDPRNFKISRHAYDVIGDDWAFGQPVTGHCISAAPSHMLSMALQGDYQFAKTFMGNDMLRYTGIRQNFNGAQRDFTRLLLPFSGVNDDVSMLVAVTRLRQPNVSSQNLRTDF